MHGGGLETSRSPSPGRSLQPTKSTHGGTGWEQHRARSGGGGSTERSVAQRASFPPSPRRAQDEATRDRDVLQMEESLSYPHAVALEDVVAVERWGVQGVGRRLVLDGAGERRRAGTQTLGHLRVGGGGQAGSGAARAQNKATGRGGLVRTDGRTDGADDVGESGFCTRSSLCPHARPCGWIGTFLPAPLFLALSIGFRPRVLLSGPLPSPRRAPKSS